MTNVACDLIYGKYIDRKTRERLTDIVHTYQKRKGRAKGEAPSVKKLQSRLKELLDELEQKNANKPQGDSVDPEIEKLKSEIDELKNTVELGADILRDEGVEDAIREIIIEAAGDYKYISKIEVDVVAMRATGAPKADQLTHGYSHFSDVHGKTAALSGEQLMKNNMANLWVPGREALRKFGARHVGSAIERTFKRVKKDIDVLRYKGETFRNAVRGLRRELNPDDDTDGNIITMQSVRGLIDGSSDENVLRQQLAKSGVTTKDGSDLLEKLKELETDPDGEFGVNLLAAYQRELQIADDEAYARYINKTLGESYASVLEDAAMKISKRNAMRSIFGTANNGAIHKIINRIYGDKLGKDINQMTDAFYGQDIATVKNKYGQAAFNTLYALRQIASLDRFAYSAFATTVDRFIHAGDLTSRLGAAYNLRPEVKKLASSLSSDQKKELTRLFRIYDTAQGALGMGNKQAEGFEQGFKRLNRFVSDTRDWNLGRWFGEIQHNNNKMQALLIHSQLLDNIRRDGFDSINERARKTLLDSGMTQKEIEVLAKSDIFSEVNGIDVLDLDKVGAVGELYQGWLTRIMSIPANRSSGFASVRSSHVLRAGMSNSPVGQLVAQMFTQGLTHPFRATFELGSELVRNGFVNKGVAKGLGIQAAAGISYGFLRTQLNEEINGKEYSTLTTIGLMVAYGTPLGFAADIGASIFLGTETGNYELGLEIAPVQTFTRAGKKLGDVDDIDDIGAAELRKIPFLNSITAVPSMGYHAVKGVAEFVTD